MNLIRKIHNNLQCRLGLGFFSTYSCGPRSFRSLFCVDRMSLSTHCQAMGGVERTNVQQKCLTNLFNLLNVQKSVSTEVKILIAGHTLDDTKPDFPPPRRSGYIYPHSSQVCGINTIIIILLFTALSMDLLIYLSIYLSQHKPAKLPDDADSPPTKIG